MAGYIKLHRQLLDSVQFSNPNYLKIWIWILLKANHKERTISIKVSKGYTEVTVGRGQFVFGRNKAEQELNLDASLIYRVIKSFQQSGSIDVKSNNQYSIITVCKYDDYNNIKEENEQPMNNGRTADEQPMNTNKNDKNDKNVKKVFIAPSLDEVVSFFSENGYPEELAAKAFKHYDLAGWENSHGKKVKNWKQTMHTVWFKEENKVEKRKMVY